jgi:long-chain acyl-CoA synthetase
MILVHHFLRDSAERSPDKAAILSEGQAYTFAWLDEQSGRLASVLQAAGLAHGDRVALFMENAADLIVSILGVLKAGGVFVAINATTRTGKLAYLLGDCGARFLIARRALASVVRQAASQAPALQTIFWAGPTRQMPEGGRSLEEVLGEPRSPLRQLRDAALAGAQQPWHRAGGHVRPRPF